MAFLFLLLSGFIIRFAGVEQTNYFATLVFAAAVMAGGAYAIIFFTGVLVHIVRRVSRRQPIMEIEE